MKQTHDLNLTKSFSPITKELTDVKESTQKLGDIMKGSKSEKEKIQEVVPVEIDSEDDNIHSNI